MTDTGSDNLFELQVDTEAATSLLESAKWTRFISVIYFILFGLFLLTASLVAAALSSDLESMMGGQEISKGLLLGILLPTLAIMFLMAWLLHRFASFTRQAIYRQDPVLLDKGIVALKNYFLIYGIFAILGIIFTVFSLIGSIAA